MPTDFIISVGIFAFVGFVSGLTLPVRGATGVRLTEEPFLSIFQSTLPVRGATESAATHHAEDQISIPAPRAGSDTGGNLIINLPDGFQSTLPVRGATPLIHTCAK